MRQLLLRRDLLLDAGASGPGSERIRQVPKLSRGEATLCMQSNARSREGSDGGADGSEVCWSAGEECWNRRV